MPRLDWSAIPPQFDAGLDRGVLYLPNGAVPWNGLVSVDEKDTSEVDVEHYFEGNRIWVSQILGEFGASVSAFTYPDAFAEYDGYSDRNIYQRFGLSYRTVNSDGYQLHVIYNALVDDSARSWSTISKAPGISLFNWEISAASVPIPGASPASHMVMQMDPYNQALSKVEDILYGTATTTPRLPAPAELHALYEQATVLKITYHGDGSYTAAGPDDMVTILDNGLFRLSAPSVYLETQDIFRVSSH